jgi:tetratricopeptide (TPR) repeat protein
MLSMASQCIHSIYNADFKQAEQEARRLIKAHPDHPAGYFFLAVVLDVWMEHYQSTAKEEEFYRYCDLAIEKGEALLDADRRNVWAQFFVGGADGYKGTYESRQGRWITAFRYGWKGVSTLMDLRKACPEMKDIDYGVGCYEYWRSAMTRLLRWLPGVEDRREEGIRKLVDVNQNGLFTRFPAAAALVSIYCNEKRYGDALDLSQRMIEKFPNSLVFYWGKGEALLGSGRFEEAEEVYAYLLARVEAESYDNHYNAVTCHYWIAKIALVTKNYTQCIAECNRMRYYRLARDVASRLEKYLDDSESIRKQAMAARARSAQSELIP